LKAKRKIKNLGRCAKGQEKPLKKAGMTFWKFFNGQENCPTNWVLGLFQ
jgi:hypothetical protein